MIEKYAVGLGHIGNNSHDPKLLHDVKLHLCMHSLDWDTAENVQLCGQ